MSTQVYPQIVYGVLLQNILKVEQLPTEVLRYHEVTGEPYQKPTVREVRTLGEYTISPKLSIEEFVANFYPEEEPAIRIFSSIPVDEVTRTRNYDREDIPEGQRAADFLAPWWSSCWVKSAVLGVKVEMNKQDDYYYQPGSSMNRWEPLCLPRLSGPQQEEASRELSRLIGSSPNPTHYLMFRICS